MAKKEIRKAYEILSNALRKKYKENNTAESKAKTAHYIRQLQDLSVYLGIVS